MRETTGHVILPSALSGLWVDRWPHCFGERLGRETEPISIHPAVACLLGLFVTRIP